MREFESWMEMFENEPFVEKQRQDIAQLHEDLFVNQRISSISFADDIPEELTAQKYLLMYKKIWATLRHDIYEEVKVRAKELRVAHDQLEETEFNKIYEKVFKNFEKVRQETYSKILDDPEITQPKAREYMQKAFVMYATISSTAKNKDTEVTRARWPDLVNNVAIEHGKLIQEMAQGKFYDKIEIDPRTVNTADEKVDLKSLPQYKKGML